MLQPQHSGGWDRAVLGYTWRPCTKYRKCNNSVHCLLHMLLRPQCITRTLVASKSHSLKLPNRKGMQVGGDTVLSKERNPELWATGTPSNPWTLFSTAWWSVVKTTLLLVSLETSALFHPHGRIQMLYRSPHRCPKAKVIGETDGLVVISRWVSKRKFLLLAQLQLTGAPKFAPRKTRGGVHFTRITS